MRAGHVVVLGVFALRTNFRAAMTRGGMLAFALIALLGPFLSWRGGRGWEPDEGLLFYGYLVGGLFILRSGLEQQRESGLQTFLRHNFATPLEHAAGAVLSLLGAWLALTGLLFLVALLVFAGDASLAAWHAVSFGLALGLLIPFVIMVEAMSSFRIPLLLPVIGFTALMVTLAFTIGEERMAALLRFSTTREDPSTLVRLAVRTGVILPAGLAMFMGAVWARARVAGRHGRPVPSGH